MKNEFEQLIPIPVRPEEQLENKDIFYPKWQCFCCQDSGKVNDNLVRVIMPNYNPSRDLWVACQNPGCHSFREKWKGIAVDNFDTRFSTVVCQKLDLKSRENWHKTVQRLVDIRTLAKAMKMPGSGERTENENREVQQRKQEVENYNWAAASKAYLGSE
jgi:hypothetical protein